MKTERSKALSGMCCILPLHVARSFQPVAFFHVTHARVANPCYANGVRAVRLPLISPLDVRAGSRSAAAGGSSASGVSWYATSRTKRRMAAAADAGRAGVGRRGVRAAVDDRVVHFDAGRVAVDDHPADVLLERAQDVRGGRRASAAPTWTVPVRLPSICVDAVERLVDASRSRRRHAAGPNASSRSVGSCLPTSWRSSRTGRATSRRALRLGRDERRGRRGAWLLRSRARAKVVAQAAVQHRHRRGGGDVLGQAVDEAARAVADGEDRRRASCRTARRRAGRSRRSPSRSLRRARPARRGGSRAG